MAGRQRHPPQRPTTNRSRTAAGSFGPLATPPRPNSRPRQRRQQRSSWHPRAPACSNLTRSPARKSTAAAPTTRGPPELATPRRPIEAPSAKPRVRRHQIDDGQKATPGGQSGRPPSPESASNRSRARLRRARPGCGRRKRRPHPATLLGTITDPRETNPAPTTPWRRTGWRAPPPCRPSVRSARAASRAGLRPVASDRASSTLDPHRADLGLAAIRGRGTCGGRLGQGGRRRRTFQSVISVRAPSYFGGGRHVSRGRTPCRHALRDPDRGFHPTWTTLRRLGEKDDGEPILRSSDRFGDGAPASAYGQPVEIGIRLGNRDRFHRVTRAPGSRARGRGPTGRSAAAGPDAPPGSSRRAARAGRRTGRRPRARSSPSPSSSA